eukprot:XP_025001576.1 translation initiation factor IF-2-like isoform X2 [Gallus gallus]
MGLGRPQPQSSSLDEEELFNMAATLRRLAAIFASHNLTPWQLLPPLLLLLQRAADTGEVPPQVVVPAITCAQLHLMWQLSQLPPSGASEVTAGAEELQSLRGPTRSFCALCQSAPERQRRRREGGGVRGAERCAVGAALRGAPSAHCPRRGAARTAGGASAGPRLHPALRPAAPRGPPGGAAAPPDAVGRLLQIGALWRPGAARRLRRLQTLRHVLWGLWGHREGGVGGGAEDGQNGVGANRPPQPAAGAGGAAVGARPGPEGGFGLWGAAGFGAPFGAAFRAPTPTVPHRTAADPPHNGGGRGGGDPPRGGQQQRGDPQGAAGQAPGSL